MKQKKLLFKCGKASFPENDMFFLLPSIMISNNQSNRFCCIQINCWFILYYIKIGFAYEKNKTKTL